jgi:ATP-dependent DNA ligase
MSETTQTELRDAIDFMKNDSGSGTKARKQERFRQVYEPAVAHLITGERYDDAGVGPVTAEKAVDDVFPDLQVADFPTITEALATVDSDGEQSLDALVSDLDSVTRRSGNSQREYVRECLTSHAEPSLVTLALLDDESIGLGTSQMREAFFDGTRDERKRAEAFVSTTAEFIRLAQEGNLPDGPTVGEPFAPMLAVPESRGQPENAVSQKKIDGYRLLLHIDNGGVTAFSRAENDVTESLPELNEMDYPPGKYIVDCEAIAETGSYSDTSERIGRSAENVSRGTEMHFDVFDIIVYQGHDVSDSAFEDRFNTAMEFVNATDDDRMNIVPVWYDIEAAKDAALEAGDEGIIVKDNRAPYEFGKRSTYWQKQKYDADTIDVVITGFHEGDGEGSGTLGAVAIESVDGVSLGNSGSGFSDSQRDEIWNNQDAYLNRVIEVEARGLGTGGKLRMPIFKRHRPEGEADPMSRIEELMDDV